MVVGEFRNRGAGYGLEYLLCEFKFQGDKFSYDWLEEKLKRKNLMYGNEKKKPYWNVIFICTVLFRLKHCFDLGRHRIKPLKPKLLR